MCNSEEAGAERNLKNSTQTNRGRKPRAAERDLGLEHGAIECEADKRHPTYALHASPVGRDRRVGRCVVGRPHACASRAESRVGAQVL